MAILDTGDGAPRVGPENLRIDAFGQRGEIRLTEASLIPSVRLGLDNVTPGLDVDGAPAGALLIGHLRSGRLEYSSRGSNYLYRPGSVFAAVQPEHLYSPTSVESDTDMTVIDTALLSRVADTSPGGRHQPVRLTGDEPFSLRAAELWISTVAYVRDAVLNVPDGPGRPLLTQSAAGLLVATVLAVFPSNVLSDPTIEDRHDAHPATLIRAKAFIDEHAHTDICSRPRAAHRHRRRLPLGISQQQPVQRLLPPRLRPHPHPDPPPPLVGWGPDYLSAGGFCCARPMSAVARSQSPWRSTPRYRPRLPATRCTGSAACWVSSAWSMGPAFRQRLRTGSGPLQGLRGDDDCCGRLGSSVRAFASGMGPPGGGGQRCRAASTGFWRWR